MVVYSAVVLLGTALLIKTVHWMIKDKVLFYLSLLPMYSAVWQTVSVLVVEYGFYITEQKAVSYFTGGALRTLFCHYVFFLLYGALARLRNPEVLASRYFVSRFAVGVINVQILWVSFGLALGFLNVALSPSPLFNNDVTRFNFMDNSAMPWVRYITAERFFYAFSLLGSSFVYCHGCDDGRKRILIYLYFSLLMYLLLIGEKFTGPVLGTLIFGIYALSAIYVDSASEGVPTRIWLYASAIFTISIIYVLYSYAFKYEIGSALGSPLLGMLYRGFVLQGHTQWGLDALFSEGRSGAMGMWVDKGYSGMAIAMSAIAPSEVLAAFENVANASFSSAYPGVVLYTGGWWLLVLLQFILAILFFVASILFSWAVRRRYVLTALLSMQIIFSIFYVYNMGNFNEFYSAKFVVSLLGIAAIFAVRLSGSDGMECREKRFSGI